MAGLSEPAWTCRNPMKADTVPCAALDRGCHAAGGFLFQILDFFAGVFLLTRWWRGSMLAHLSLRRQFEGRSFFGGSIQVALEVENKGWLPVPWIELQDALPVHLVSPPFVRLSLGPRTAPPGVHRLRPPARLLRDRPAALDERRPAGHAPLSVRRAPAGSPHRLSGNSPPAAARPADALAPGRSARPLPAL